MTRFIDRSNVNGTDDYAKAGITHVYLKATEGTAFTDATYESRRAAAHAAKAIVGAYHFADLQDPATECAHFLTVIGKPNTTHMRPCLDLERGTPVTDHAWAEGWVSHFHTAMGYMPTLYGSTSLVNPLRAASALLRACPLWRAEYGPNDGAVHPLQGGDQGASAHQYTSEATFPGIAGRTDANVFLAHSELLVPTVVAKPKRPKAARITYVTAAGKRDGVTVSHPLRWQIRNPRVWWHGDAQIHPIR